MRTFLVLLLLAVGCWGAGAKSDSAIEQDLKVRLGRSKIAANGFQYRVRDGVVTWTGQTGVIQHKGAATRMARSAGAKEVVNNIRIGEAAREKAAARLATARQEKPKAAGNITAAPAQPAAVEQAPPPVRRATVKH